jgi:hypothetical protein
VVGLCALLFLLVAILLGAVLIYRRMANRLCWLNQLEQFKTAHIYAAFQHMQESEKKPG